MPPLFSSKSIDTLYFAVHISEVAAQAVLWKITELGPEIMSTSQPHKWQDEESCVNAIDQSLQELGSESENVKDTLFALEGSWVNAQGIVSERKSLFQKITKELSLEAVGFVVTAEALLQHFNETMPQMSYFLIDFTLEEQTLTLIKQGQVQHVQKVGRSGDTVSDFIEGFAHFEDKTFPPKMLLFSSVLTTEEMHDLRQQLFDHDWTSKYPFLQQPVIDIYPADNLLEVVVHTGGRAIAESKGIKMQLVTASPDPSLVEHFDTQENVSTLPKQVQNGGAPSKENHPQPELTSLHDEGTLAGDFTPVDTRSSAKNTLPPPSNEELDNLMPATSFGVPISRDHLPSQLQKHAAQSENDHPSHAHNNAAIEDHERTSVRFLIFDIPHKLHLKAVLPFIVIGVVVGLLLLYATAVFATGSLMKAQVAVELNSQPISKDTSLTLDPTISESDVTRQILKAEIISKDVSGNQDAPATGAKIIGDKAKGKATLFNRTSSSKTFPAGTSLSVGKLKYSIDTSVTVASASTGQNFETKPGTADVNITAGQIGSESNLDNDTDLTIESFGKETYVARTSSDVTGGSSREILAVSQQDRDKLLADLKKSLTDQAIEQFKSEAGGGKYIIPTGSVKVTDKKYSAEVGKEANTFSLQLQLQVDALSYQTDDLKPLVLEVLKSDIPAGYQINDQEPQILSSPASSPSASGKVILNANVTAVANPIVDPETWKTEIAGKTDTEATQLLEAKPEVKSAMITLTPRVLTYLSHKIPQIKNILITITNLK